MQSPVRSQENHPHHEDQNHCCQIRRSSTFMWSNISHARGLREQQELSSSDQVSDEDGQVRSRLAAGWGSPLMRYKHAVCSAANGYIFIHGGRFGNLALDDDVWRFDPHQNGWLQLQTGGCKPPSLQEHTLVEFREQLYLFGGQVSASNTENSFWRLSLATCEWQSLSMKSSKFGAHLGPTNRRGHSAVIHKESMYIFGGFEDFRGSSGQLWEFNLITERWELRNLSSTSACHPEPRHSHSAVVLDDSMFVYGGLSNLKPLGDLWRWSWREKRWFKERTRGKSPGQLHGHTAIQAFGSMFVFGGERNGRPTRGLWRLNLSNMSWQKIRPKGPRPSPTTWHAAIANPLSILDEANYIIEGDDSDLLLKNNNMSSLSDNCFSTFHHDLEEHQQKPIKVEVQNKQELNNSLSPPNKWSACTNQPQEVNRTPLFAQNHQEERAKRKSRLSFLRRGRHTRPRSTYELKQLSEVVGAGATPSGGSSLRHSASITSTLRSVSKTDTAPQQIVETTDDNNIKILDNLDTDIKQMFERAMSPEEEDEPMSVDISRNHQTSHLSTRSQYQTAVQQVNSLTDLQLRSQRTSYAYTTPPSELNTLRDQPSTCQVELPETQSTIERLVSQGLLSSRSPVTSGFNRRDNRPKSEIVQSLIDRADARIKHLYTPFFTQQQQQQVGGKMFASDKRQRDTEHKQRDPSSLDKSKRHTIHQTMTYYNLYFSEDKSSNSPPSSDSNNAPAASQDPVQPSEASSSNRLTRDDTSSSTIKNLATATTSGTLVGVRGGSQLDSQREDSQLSLEVSSDSRTLCGEASGLPRDTPLSSSLQSAPNAALTGRRDTASESCDNTSLSFSVIAEFEEDDMLQYSSPTEPLIVHRQVDYKSGAPGAPVSDHQGGRADEGEPDMLATTTVRMMYHQDEGVLRVERPLIVDSKPEQVSKLVAKSTSSGYDSMSGARETIDHLSTQQGTSDTQEDSSVQTDSSLGFTSPEQSVAKSQQHKKLRARSILERRKKDISAEHLKTTASSTTADSLALDCSVGSSSQLPNTTCPPLQINSLPSSPPESQVQSLLVGSATQPKIPLVSRSTRFFSKQKSKKRYWQLCMFVIGGKQNSNGTHGNKEPITIWRLYI